jgi:hypothetical protein
MSLATLARRVSAGPLAPPPTGGQGRPRGAATLATLHQEIAALPEGAVILAADEAHVNVLPWLPSTWIVKGERQGVMTPGKNEKRSIFGAIELARLLPGSLPSSDAGHRGSFQHALAYRRVTATSCGRPLSMRARTGQETRSEPLGANPRSGKLSDRPRWPGWRARGVGAAGPAQWRSGAGRPSVGRRRSNQSCCPRSVLPGVLDRLEPLQGLQGVRHRERKSGLA